MILSLNGKEIQGYNFLVTGEQPLPDEDLSAQTSSTLTAEKGFKSKRLRVNFNIKFTDVGYLKSLMSIVQGVDEQGRRQIYTINNQTATAMGIRQVRFSESVSVKEMGEVQAWAISFVLLEHKSIPEKRESKTLAAEEKAATGTSTNTASVDKQVAAEADNASWFEENVLSPIDSFLGSGEGDVDVV
ncbi:hypothetical protein M3I01_013365 [Marinomonas sp. RSW2]|uniref:DNA-binding protein n=1 Tax=Marinomonas maritima TaxID=2940935 RepID=A0ABT5WJQ3_9GAMM|nr:hypothetical protein [Marinomonas maritima]MDE8603886.1 hypothetical protein [Marinomonas maritima]